jgi:two-component system, NtrC family, response regulator HydG
MITLAHVLLVDDGEPSVSMLQNVIESAGHAVLRTDGIDETVWRLGAGGADVVVLPSTLVQSLDRLVETQCGAAPASFIVYGDESAPNLARIALRAGATEVIDRAAGESVLLVAIERATRDGQLKRELAMLRARVGDAAQQSLVGRSAATTRLRETVGRAAASRAPVVVVGEVGTGKDIVARLVHDLSDRATRPLLTIRCAGADAAALERELFGCAPSEGTRARAGLLEESRGGTIVLDDAPALPAALRLELARASTSRSARRVGASEPYPTDFRLVLTARVGSGDADGCSADDLLARCNALLIEVPPLRDRRSDIPQLVQHFRRRLAEEQGFELSPLPSDAMLPLLGKEWTGNVRELEHWVERNALAGRVEQRDSDTTALRAVDPRTSEITLDQLERAYILRVLALESGHQSRAAARLGIDRRTLYRKLKQYRNEGALAS